MKTALLVIDVQMGFVHRDAAGTPRSCPQAEQNIGALLTAFRANGNAVIHIHHHTMEAVLFSAPTYRAGPCSLLRNPLRVRRL